MAEFQAGEGGARSGVWPGPECGGPELGRARSGAGSGVGPGLEWGRVRSGAESEVGPGLGWGRVLSGAGF